MKKLLRQWWLPAIGAVVGAAGGFLYWKYIGCNSGACAITSRPFNSTVYFAVLGALVFSLFQPKREKPA